VENYRSIEYFFSLSNRVKKSLLIIIDSLSFGFTASSCLLITQYFIPEKIEYEYLVLALGTIFIIAIPSLIYIGLYNNIARWWGGKATAGLIFVFIAIEIVYYLQISLNPYTQTKYGHLLVLLLTIAWMMEILAVRFTIVAARVMTANVRYEHRKNIIIYGAGQSGRGLINSRELKKTGKIVAFIDDDSMLWGRRINGIKIFKFQEISLIIKELDAQEVVVAIPSATRSIRLQIINKLRPYNLHIKTARSIDEETLDGGGLEATSELDVMDVLGRPEALAEPKYYKKITEERVILVTGAGGSIGSEIVRQLCRAKPSKVILLELSEFNLHKIKSELDGYIAKNKIKIELIPVLGNILNQELISQIIKKNNVTCIYHGAAYKHVSLVEDNLCEAVLNNVIGTYHLVKSAINANIENFVFISSDKAVRPTSAMGATKRAGELIIQAMCGDNVYNHSPGVYTIVRFGNVLNSSGSVVPIFRRQIESGGPVTVTHRDATRFFMTIPEAATLVLEAAGMAYFQKELGKIYILEMGDAVNIYDLAVRLIQFSGSKVRSNEDASGIEIRIIGLRDGEKLHEELIIDGNLINTDNPKIYQVEERSSNCISVLSMVEELEIHALNRNNSKVLEVLKRLIPEYSGGKRC